MKKVSWSMDLEDEEYVRDKNKILRDARWAIEIAAAGMHVNLVTPASYGEPIELIQQLTDEYEDKIEVEFVEQCGCGGYVTKVTILKH